MTTTKEELIRIKNTGVGKDWVEISTLMLHCICDMARDSLDLQAENARLKAAMERYSEDEMLLIERCAKACEVMGAKHFECPEMSEYCADAIRALKVERRKGERRVKQVRQYFTENGNERSGTDRRKK